MIGLVAIWAALPIAWSQSAIWQPQGATTGNIYYNGGNVWIGSSSPAYTLDINGPVGIQTGWARLFLKTGALTAAWLSQDGNGNAILDTPTGAGQIILSTQGIGRFNVLQNGNIGIATNNPQHLLHVAGVIGAEEIIVSSTGADYVFDPGYRLRPLHELAGYIEQNHHLPDIPSAEEAKARGLSVGEMQNKLLAKIEELTLHMIQADERNDRLENQNRELRERIARLEAIASR